MTVTKSDVYIFHDAEKTEKALEKMERAIGKKHEAAAAIKFAHTILDLWGERKTIENEAERKRLDLLDNYYKIQATKIRIQEAMRFASGLAGEIYNQYRALGGDHYEAESYRTGKSRKEVIEEDYSKPRRSLIDTHSEQAEEKIEEAASNA
jgi:hypothetical protein